jgi:hypothetical protein
MIQPQSKPDIPLTYASRPPSSTARRQAVWLLIVAAAMFIVIAVDYLGFDLRVWFAPGTATTPAQMEWHGDAFSFARWRDDPGGSVLAVSVCAAIITLFLLSAWGVRRRARWAAISAMTVSLLFGGGFIFEAVADSMTVGRKAWNVFHGATDGTGLSVLQYVWTFGLGLVLLATAFRLWSVVREPRVA